MPVTATHLTTGSSPTDATSYASSSITPSAAKLVLCFVAWAQSTPGTPSVTGNSLTWVQVGSTVTSGSRAAALFRTMGASPASGAVTLTITGGTGTPSRAGWSIAEFGSVDTTGSSGTNAVVQSASNSTVSGSTLTVTLGAFGSANNATYGGFLEDVSNGITVGSGFTQLGQSNEATEGFSVQSQWKTTNDTSVDWTAGATTTLIGIAVEIKYASPTAGFFSIL